MKYSTSNKNESCEFFPLKARISVRQVHVTSKLYQIPIKSTVESTNRFFFSASCN